VNHQHGNKTRPARFRRGLAAIVTGLALLSAAPASASVSQRSLTNPLLAPLPNSHAIKLRKKPAHRPVGPALVTDLRIKHYPERVRIVFDLQRSVKFSQTRRKRPDRVIVELQNTKLTQTVQHKVERFALPGDLTITQSNPQAVTVALYLDKISDFKLLPLKEPDYPTDERQDPLGQTGGQAAAAVSPGLAPPAPPPPGPPPSGDTEPMMGPAPPSQPPQLKALRRPVRDDIKTIVIDPGHGGKDPGAIGRGKVQEKHITLKVGMKLRDLITARLGRKVLMTRERDVFVELEDRTKFANHHDADLFVSIHVNSHPQRSARGLEIYHFGKASDRRALEVAARENGTPIESTGIGWQYLVADLLTDKKIEDSLELAWTARQAMVARLNGYYDVVDLGVKTAPFYVLRFTTMPSILAEIGFVSNPTEERLMQGEAFLTRMAEAIFDGLKAFINPLQTAGAGGKG
jgi:N-acetylmuramoyl-L-alanine amidase